MVKGSAGFISSAIDFYQRYNDPNILEICKYAGEHLIKNYTEYSKEKIGWRISSDYALAGMAHGCSGFLVAFSKLLKVVNDDRYNTIIQKIINYENSLFDIDEMNWKDLRKYTIKEYGDNKFYTAWSHGAGGVGMSRLYMLRNNIRIKNIDIKKDLDFAIKNVMLKGFTGDNSLIFGDFGNIELLIEYNNTYNNKEVGEFIKGQINILSDQIKEIDLNSKRDSINSLGIMSGVTGIAYQLLRLKHIDKVPSILLTN